MADGEEERQFTDEELAKGKRVTEYYEKHDPNSPIPPDETRTHNFRNITEDAQSKVTKVDEEVSKNGA